jgi:F-type H+-transporting ATPase subunit gamma
METLQGLRDSIDTAEALRSVVKTMKALAAVSIRHYQDAMDSLTDYHRTVALGLQIAMRERPKGFGLQRELAEEGKLGVIVIGSDQGMCGQFNEQVAAHATGEIDRQGAREKLVMLAVGLRVVFPLERAGLRLDEVFSVPASLSGLTPLVQDVLLKIDEWSTQLAVERFVIYHNRQTGRASYQPHSHSLLPVEEGWLEELASHRWGGRGLPIFSVDWETLFAALIRQHLLVSVYRSIVESLAAENASRMASMQAAERNIDERLQELIKRFNQQRQTAITSELLDIVSGFEALTCPQA